MQLRQCTGWYEICMSRCGFHSVTSKWVKSMMMMSATVELLKKLVFESFDMERNRHKT